MVSHSPDPDNFSQKQLRRGQDLRAFRKLLSHKAAERAHPNDPGWGWGGEQGRVRSHKNHVFMEVGGPTPSHRIGGTAIPSFYRAFQPG